MDKGLYTIQHTNKLQITFFFFLLMFKPKFYPHEDETFSFIVRFV